MYAKIFFTLIFSILLGGSFFAKNVEPEPWGFFGHKLINRLAVFTLPPAMVPFYKKHIDFIGEHAVDPDKRRYASKHEAPRHYMDLDRYGKEPIKTLPRKWNDALIKFSDIYVITETNDTLQLFDYQKHQITKEQIVFKGAALRKLTRTDSVHCGYNRYRNFFVKNILPNFYEDVVEIPLDSLKAIFPINTPLQKAFLKDNLSPHGIVPYHLVAMQQRLTDAFRQKNIEKILRLSAEFGHYIGDAHVPLHTTENYNGQKTNQHGIHGFWESRIPELFSDNYDFWVGDAKYIQNVEGYYWNVVGESNKLVDTLLKIEKKLSQTYPSDQIMCLEERMGVTIKTYCESYAKTFSDKLEGQVESRMREAVLSVGSAWLTAWQDAGEPDLNALLQSEVSTQTQEDLQLEKASQSGKSMIGRSEN